MTIEDFLAFNVPNEIKSGICQKRISPFYKFTPFASLLAVRYQANPWILDAANFLCVDTSHNGKLQEIFRFAVRICTNIHYIAYTGRGGEGTCQGRAVH